MSNQHESESSSAGKPRRDFLSSAALAGAALAGFTARAQEPENTRKAESGHFFSNPGPENEALRKAKPNSNVPPPTDHGNSEPIWYSFDLTHKRVEEGGWTSQVTQRELPSSKDVAGVRMRLTPGAYRELHWHTAGEWAYMFYGNARVTV